MARRKRGRPVHGWLILDKPAGISSASAVAKARWAFDARKAGHAGTLDPDATGLLAIAFGEATKTVPVLMDALKTYRFTLSWGAATSTDDASGEVIATSSLRPDKGSVRAVLPGLTGNIMQVPPQVSAVKIGGERAYALARSGQEVEIAARPLFVSRLELLDMPDRNTAVLEMICGKGGYVRSIGRDLGRELGCLAHVQTLRRIASGPFDLAQALGWENLDESARTGDLDHKLLPVAAALEGITRLEVPGEIAPRLRNGNPVEVQCGGPADETRQAWATTDGVPLALGELAGGIFRPGRVFVFD